jgi:EAL domain-containing protein (putative c-di-GMP-specific phosphodiesterase class I)
MLRLTGCSHLQGFLFGHAVPSEHAVARLNERAAESTQALQRASAAGE